MSKNIKMEKAAYEFIKNNHSELINDDFALGFGFQEGVKWEHENIKNELNLMKKRLENKNISFAAWEIINKTLNKIEE